MKSILIPMDFTSVAINALKYGLKLFENAKFTVLHASFTVGKNPELFGSKPGNTNSSFLKNELKNLILHELDLRALPDNINIMVELGDPSEVIKNKARSQQFDAIIMGTRDKYSFFDKWIGTISLSLVKTLETPIYLIPRYAKYEGIKHVVIASESKTSTEKNMEKIATWNNNFSADLNFVHVNKNESERLKEEFYQKVKTYFKENDNEINLQINDVQGVDVCKSILAKAYNTRANLVMILPGKQNFLTSLIINSISKEMILSSDIPMLFLNN
jgi:nucleotide-binding universal stress UspA family protein